LDVVVVVVVVVVAIVVVVVFVVVVDGLIVDVGIDKTIVIVFVGCDVLLRNIGIVVGCDGRRWNIGSVVGWVLKVNGFQLDH
jgi:hypothetical protein